MKFITLLHSAIATDSNLTIFNYDVEKYGQIGEKIFEGEMFKLIDVENTNEPFEKYKSMCEREIFYITDCDFHTGAFAHSIGIILK